ncbi:hypothetical protein CLV35_0987 [Motilibacter peucedani]|uniref:YjbR protein n=1 Tax=Motilibacter peucedani TaxID=598650 RepID=A0A420XUY0_9ACTN|nr:MmcQ/YjbR family DNA-binding protein [Motilibacter peucedani]RKS80550.1 hypothetical protein CLV35_0987 [Motilibacter peucedani]
MPSFADVAALALELPGTEEGVRYGHRTWQVGGKVYAWERPFSKADIKRFGSTAPPSGPVLAVSVADLGEKEAVLAAGDDAFFTIPHFDGYAAVLVELDRVGTDALREALEEAWACVAPAEAVAAHLRTHRASGGGGASA